MPKSVNWLSSILPWRCRALAAASIFISFGLYALRGFLFRDIEHPVVKQFRGFVSFHASSRGQKPQALFEFVNFSQEFNNGLFMLLNLFFNALISHNEQLQVFG